MNVSYANNTYTITLCRNGSSVTHVFKDLVIQLTDWSDLPVPTNCRYFIDARPSFETVGDYDKMRIVFLESKEELVELRRLFALAKETPFAKFVREKAEAAAKKESPFVKLVREKYQAIIDSAELPGENIM